MYREVIMYSLYLHIRGIKIIFENLYHSKLLIGEKRLETDKH